MNWYNQDSWNYDDPHPGLPLNKIFPLSRRAESLYARNKANQEIEDGFLNISGAIKMMDGMEHHIENFRLYHSQLYKGKDIRKKIIAHEFEKNHLNKIKHEIVAYINRVGQFYHFIDSKFVKHRVPHIHELTPTIKKLSIFRNKYTAHRSLDKPRKEDGGREMYHEVSFGQGSTYNAEGNMIFQICTAENALRFDPEREHQLIMEEAYCVIERLTQVDMK